MNRAAMDEVTSAAPEGWFLDGDPGRGAVLGTKIMIFGCAPLPFENQKMNFAPGLRTWQFAKPLADDGHTVVVVAMRIPGAYETGAPIDRIEHSGVVVYTMDEGVFRETGVMSEAVSLYQPDVVIGASSSTPCLRSVELAGDRPLWIDLFGDLMAEAQARQGFHPDADLIPYRSALVALLERGDVFSAVSDRQRFSTMGQLGMVGRLNEAIRGTELVHTMPCCVYETDPPTASQRVTADPVEFESGDFVVLWGGGFNTWCDIDTLFEGMELAMAENRSLRLAVTGGAIPGHDDLTYPRFLDRVRRSRHSDRFVVKGPLDTWEAEAYRRRADLGVITEKQIPERLLGSSGRILHWLSQGLPLVCTDLSELGAILAENDLAWTYRPGDSHDFARAILDAAANPERGSARARQARDYACEHWSMEATAMPVRRWVGKAVRAPDAGIENPLSMTTMVGSGEMRRLSGEMCRLTAELTATRAELDSVRERYNQTRSELGKIHHSRMWKVWMTYLGLGGRFRSMKTPPPDSE